MVLSFAWGEAFEMEYARHGRRLDGLRIVDVPAKSDELLQAVREAARNNMAYTIIADTGYGPLLRHPDGRRAMLDQLPPGYAGRRDAGDAHEQRL